MTLYDDPVTHELLKGKTVTSEMVMMVVPKSDRSIADNAVQKSEAIVIAGEG